VYCIRLISWQLFELTPLLSLRWAWPAPLVCSVIGPQGGQKATSSQGLIRPDGHGPTRGWMCGCQAADFAV